MELKEVLLRRKSCRAYEERSVEKEKLNEWSLPDLWRLWGCPGMESPILPWSLTRRR